MAKVDIPKEKVVEAHLSAEEEIIEVPDFPSNSDRSKDERRKMEKVVSGSVKRRRKSFGKQLKEDIFSDETPRSIFSYIWEEVVLPAAKDTISDMVTEGIQMLLFGEDGRRTRGTSRSHGASHISYDRCYSRPDIRKPRSVNVSRERYDFDDILIESRSEAMDVLEVLECSIEQYGMASVSDFYELVGLDSAYTDNKYGWTDLSGATIRRTREGYLIDLPRTKRID